MIPLVLIYLALLLIFAAAGVGTWILRGHGLRAYRPPEGDEPLPGKIGEGRARP